MECRVRQRSQGAYEEARAAGARVEHRQDGCLLAAVVHEPVHCAQEDGSVHRHGPGAMLSNVRRIVVSGTWSRQPSAEPGVGPCRIWADGGRRRQLAHSTAHHIGLRTDA